MRKPLLALMRGADGRSLARALVVLFLVNMFAAGFHNGAMATGDTAFALCTLATQNGPDHSPPADHTSPCCTIGCPLPGIADVTAPPMLAAPNAPIATASVPAPVERPRLTLSPIAPQPRGPPSFA